jgi:hypothetical protein
MACEAAHDARFDDANADDCAPGHNAAQVLIVDLL